MLCIILLLIFGAATTVIVAWGCVAVIDMSSWVGSIRTGGSLVANRISWIGAEQRSSTICLITSVWEKYDFDFTVAQTDWRPREIIPTWTGFSNPDELLGQGFIHVVIDIADCRGWPFHALWSHPTHASLIDGVHVIGSSSGGLAIGFPPFTNMYGHVVPRLLPFRPIWSGFLLDTLFYAAIWGGLFFGLAAARRIIRRKRGRCPFCAYDLRGELAAGCPECGWNRNKSEPRA